MAGLKYSISQSICTVSIDNAEAGQSFGPIEASALVKLIKSKEFKACTGLIWTTAENGIFCSGGNLKHYQKQTQRTQGIQTNRKIASALKILSEIEIPTVAVVNGDAFGGGVELLGSFDFVLSTPKSLFGLWQRRIGLTFGWGGGARLEKRMGSKKIIQNSLLAQSFSSFEAAEIGLVDAILPVPLIESRAIELILKSNKRPRAPFKPIKLWSSLKEQSIFEKLWFNNDHREVLKKF